jgi:L-amino acid N-acyltransferase YncA
MDEYVELRNSYCKELASEPVTVESTKKWLFSEQGKIFCVIEGAEVLGAAILHIKRGNEVSLFVKDKREGIGSRLLAKMTHEAGGNMWAWVVEGNEAAEELFRKKGFKEWKGTMFIKRLVTFPG